MEQKKVGDLMIPLDQYATVQAESTIREALQALSKAQRGLDQNQHLHRAVLVLDKSGKVIGKLSHWAVLRALEPQFLRRNDLRPLHRAGLTEEFIENIRRNFSLFTGGLEQMCRAAGRIKVRDAMVPVAESIDEGAKIPEAIRELVLKHVQSMVVTRKGTVVGILRLSDVFEEVAEIIRKLECV